MDGTFHILVSIIRKYNKRDNTHPFFLQKMVPLLRKMDSRQNYNSGTLIPKGTFTVPKTSKRDFFKLKGDGKKI